LAKKHNLSPVFLRNEPAKPLIRVSTAERRLICTETADVVQLQGVLAQLQGFLLQLQGFLLQLRGFLLQLRGFLLQLRGFLLQNVPKEKKSKQDKIKGEYIKSEKSRACAARGSESRPPFAPPCSDTNTDNVQYCPHIASSACLMTVLHGG